MLDSEQIAPKILVAAFKCYAARDYRATSLSKIAEYAGTTKQVVLHHFTSKQQLYFEVLNMARERLIGWLDDAESTSSSTDELLGNFILKLHEPERAETLRVTLRAISDPVVMELGVHKWPLRPFFDKLRVLTSNEKTRSSETEEKAFALVYGLLGSAGLFAATGEVLSSMYGDVTLQNIATSMERESRHRIAWL